MTATPIPRTIHYCWFGGKPHPDSVARCMESWRRHCPEYAVKEWNESNSPVELPYVANALANGKWANASNLVRLIALYEEGGLYFDTDIEVVRTFDSLLGERCFFGWQHNQDNEPVNDAVIGAVRGHPFLDTLRQAIVAEFDGTEQANLSAPWILSETLKRQGLRPRRCRTLRSRFRRFGRARVGDVTIFPTDYFYPYAWYETFSESCVTRNTYCIHHWDKRWD